MSGDKENLVASLESVSCQIDSARERLNSLLEIQRQLTERVMEALAKHGAKGQGGAA